MRRHKRYPRYRASARQAPQLALRWLAVALIGGMVLLFPDWLGAQGLRSNVASVRLTVVKLPSPTDEARRAVDTQLSIPQAELIGVSHVAVSLDDRESDPVLVRDQNDRLQSLLNTWVQVAADQPLRLRLLVSSAGARPQTRRVAVRFTKTDGSTTVVTRTVSFVP